VIETLAQHRIGLHKHTTGQRQIHRIPTSFKGDGKAIKGRRKSVQKQ